MSSHATDLAVNAKSSSYMQSHNLQYLCLCGVVVCYVADVVLHANGCTACHSASTCGNDIVVFAGISLSN